MMGVKSGQKDLFAYSVDLDKRVRAEHPLRKVRQVVDFSFIRGKVEPLYGYNGNISVDPEVIAKLLFLLFFDDIKSERELMRIIPERLDYLWFLGYGLDEELPDHSVLSKARKRWGKEVFEELFIRTVWQCVQAGLVEGHKIHMDASLVEASASKDSILKGPPELIAALKKAYGRQEQKLEEQDDDEQGGSGTSINDGLMSKTDPDAEVVRHIPGGPRPAYKHHRVVDNASGVITAVETTLGNVDEGSRLMSLVDQHQDNTLKVVGTVVADSKYGTVKNYQACQERGLHTHMADLSAKQAGSGRREGIFDESAFSYEPQSNTLLCPAGQTLRPRRLHPLRRSWEYVTAKGVCPACNLRSQCTRSKTSRTIKRFEHHELIQQARAQARSWAAKKDRLRRKHLMEGSFADAANNHGFKRSRWRRLWRQEIQDYLIAAIQNIRILIRHGTRAPTQAMTQLLENFRSINLFTRFGLVGTQ